ncbi:MAG: flavin reductase family protein [Deinococcota bacterium]
MSNPQDFRHTLGRFATGVTVITVQHEGITRGITVSAFMSLSLEPPLVGVCIDKHAQAHATLLATKQYGVSILREGQADVSTHFAGHPSLADDPFTDVHGMPLIADALAHIICDVDAQHDVGDHTFFVGRVTHLAWYDGEPLLYSQGSYRYLTPLGEGSH